MAVKKGPAQGAGGGESEVRPATGGAFIDGRPRATRLPDRRDRAAPFGLPPIRRQAGSGESRVSSMWERHHIGLDVRRPIASHPPLIAVSSRVPRPSSLSSPTTVRSRFGPELLPPAGGEPVELGPAVVFREPPFGLNPAAIFQSVEGGIE
jgi:hypothetical protein